MDYKNRMILFFILIAIIPVAALSAVFSFTVIKFREEMSIVYQGFVPNLGILSKNKADLAGIRSDLVQFTATSEPQKSARMSHMLELKSGIDGSMDEYKRIEDLPKAFDQPFGFVFPVDSFNVSKLASDETLLVADVNQQWDSYSTRVEDLSILASDPSFSAQANAEASQLMTQADRLIASYDSLYTVNVQIGDALRERSLQTMQLAFIYGGFASAISAASATAAAILVSKRVVLGDLVRMTKLELVETTLRDLIGGGADALLAMVKSQMSEEQPVVQQADITTAVVPSQADIVIGGAKKEQPATQTGTKAFVEDYEPLAAAGQELKGKLVMINYGGNSRASPRVTWTMNQLFESPKLVLLTRRGSNFYHQARGKYAVCVLGDPAQNGRKADERVVPSDDEADLAQAVEDLVRENPASTVLLDNATELIYTLGFDRVFSLLRRLAGVVSTYEDASVVVLINKKAHEPRMIEAVSNISNTFID